MCEREGPRAGSSPDGQSAGGDRQRARALDAEAVGILRGAGALELALGETLRQLFEGGRLLKLGPARDVDYVREHLGGKWRAVQDCLRLARGLADRPLLRRAVIAGMVSPRKARMVFPVARDDAEGAWTWQAARLGEEELREAIRGAGHSPPPAESAAFESLVVSLTPDQRERLELGLSMAERRGGMGEPRWRHYEAMAQEFLSSYPEALVEWDAALSSTAPATRPDDDAQGRVMSPAEARRLADLVERQLAALEEAGLLLAERAPGVEEVPTDALQLHRRVLRLRAAQVEHDEALGAVLFDLSGMRAWETLGYRSREAYCRDRLEIAPRTLRDKVFLERKLRDFPSLRVALKNRKLNWAQARLIARQATVFDIEHRIEQAASTTVQQLYAEDDAERERQNRVRGVEKLWGPKDALPVILDAIACAQLVAAHAGERIGEGEALARVAHHFYRVWQRHKKPRISRKRRAIYERQKGRCAVPGCSGKIQHLHHLEPRARGGSDDLDNLIGLCAYHHLSGVHGGLLEVRGRSGTLVRWRFRGTGEEWVTRGGCEVRRVAAASSARPPRGGEV